MEAIIDKDGKLTLIPEKEVEEFAILQWLKHNVEENFVICMREVK